MTQAIRDSEKVYLDANQPIDLRVKDLVGRMTLAEKISQMVFTRRAIGPDDDELASNPRARSALLRVGIRTDAPAESADRAALGLPKPALMGL